MLLAFGLAFGQTSQGSQKLDVHSTEPSKLSSTSGHDQPRDRQGSFEPQLVRKNQTRLTSFLVGHYSY